VEQAAAARGVQLEVLKLDLTDSASIEAAVAEVVEAAGGLYGLVNNGGIGLRGCLEDCSEEEIRNLFETNVIGTIL
jgi:NAD(P)-dependent dehydrogenase (short-subunit alcohol dehydrogenase family)